MEFANSFMASELSVMYDELKIVRRRCPPIRASGIWAAYAAELPVVEILYINKETMLVSTA